VVDVGMVIVGGVVGVGVGFGVGVVLLVCF